MNIANWCVVAACLLPVFSVGLAKASLARVKRQQGGYDNRLPRAWEEKLTGWQQRAVAAQKNGFEALPLFIAGVILAQLNHAEPFMVDMIAMSFVAVRCVYIALYLANQAALRSLVWFIGVSLSISLFCLN